VGYFPTYTLGAMNAAQLFDQATTDDPEIMPNIQRGEFKPLLDWIRPRIHEKASLLQTPDLMRQATGRPLDAKVFRRHLEQRYLGVSR
jgi:carboxypeptidase Taq